MSGPPVNPACLASPWKEEAVVDELNKLAVEIARTPFVRPTKAGVRRAVRRLRLRGGGMNQKARVRRVYDLACQIRRKRTRRFFDRYVRPVPPLHERLRAWRERRARAAAREREGPMQFWAAACQAPFWQARGRRDEHNVRSEVVQRESEVIASGECYAITRRRSSSEHRFRIAPDWLACVHEPGLAILDGKLTLWAKRRADAVRRGRCVEVYRAVWCRQGPGSSLLTERGFIARLGPHSCHAEEKAAAVVGVLRKVQEAVKDAKAGCLTAAGRAGKRQVGPLPPQRHR